MCAFSNVNKVQLTRFIPGKRGVSVSNLLNNDEITVQRWERKLARAELKYAAPDVIVMFAGVLRWVACANYNSDHDQAKNKRATTFSIPSASDVTQSISSSFLYGIVNGFTYHPNALEKHVSTDRAALLDWLYEQCVKKGKLPGNEMAK